MATKTVSSPVFELGRVRFRVKDCEVEGNFKRDLSLLLPHSRSQYENEEDIVEVSVNGADLRAVVNDILKRHDDCLWADAACLLSTNGKKFLLVGASSSGKSTTSMALALGFGWKVLAEDVTLIDPATNEVLRFPSPFSLKSGTAELLRQSVGSTPDPILLGEFFPMNSVAAESSIKAPFDFAIVLDRRQPDLKMTEIRPDDFIRRALPVSNILRVANGAPLFTSFVESGKCFSLSGGTVEQRLDILRGLAGE